MAKEYDPYHSCNAEVLGKLHMCEKGLRIELLNNHRLSIVYYDNDVTADMVVIHLAPADYYESSSYDRFLVLNSVEIIDEIIKALEDGKKRLRQNG